MTAPRRRLTLEDVAGVMTVSAAAKEPMDIYRAVDALARETVGYLLLTVFRPVEETAELERVYSSDMQAYPVGGRKRLDTINRDPELARRGEIFLAPDWAAVQRTYPDHALLARLGVGAILNVPIRHRGRWLGTLNCCSVEHGFGADEVTAAKVLAGLLVPTLLAAQSS